MPTYYNANAICNVVLFSFLTFLKSTMCILRKMANLHEFLEQFVFPTKPLVLSLIISVSQVCHTDTGFFSESPRTISSFSSLIYFLRRMSSAHSFCCCHCLVRRSQGGNKSILFFFLTSICYQTMTLSL